MNKKNKTKLSLTCKSNL